jgi:hypothetical protein
MRVEGCHTVQIYVLLLAVKGLKFLHTSKVLYEYIFPYHTHVNESEAL